jgi:hypothetical protein
LPRKEEETSSKIPKATQMTFKWRATKNAVSILAR